MTFDIVVTAIVIAVAVIFLYRTSQKSGCSCGSDCCSARKPPGGGELPMAPCQHCPSEGGERNQHPTS
jgi:hypothetical protein